MGAFDKRKRTFHPETHEYKSLSQIFQKLLQHCTDKPCQGTATLAGAEQLCFLLPQTEESELLAADYSCYLSISHFPWVWTKALDLVVVAALFHSIRLRFPDCSQIQELCDRATWNCSNEGTLCKNYLLDVKFHNLSHICYLPFLPLSRGFYFSTLCSTLLKCRSQLLHLILHTLCVGHLFSQRAVVSEL